MMTLADLRRSTRMRRASIALALSFGLILRATAQEDPLPISPVHLLADPRVSPLLARATTAAREGQWDTAVPACADLLLGFPDELVEVAPGRYRTVRAVVGEATRSWPPARVAALRAALGAEADERLEPEPPPVETSAPPVREDAWPTLGGDSGRSRLQPSAAELPPMLWSVANEPATRYGIPRSADSVAALDVDLTFPVVGDGTVFVHNDVQIWAYDLFRGKGSDPPLWTYPQRPRVARSAVIFEADALCTGTLADGRLFANLVWSLDEPDRQLDWLDIKLPLPRRALVALDAQTGRLLWRFGGLRPAEGLEFAEAASLACAPAMAEGGLYVGAVYQRSGTDPREHWLCRIDAATGELQWRTFVCAGFGVGNLMGNPVQESVGTPVTIARGSALYATNSGAIVAVDAHSGRVRWLVRHPKLQIPATLDVEPDLPARCWSNNPILVQGTRMFVAPSDSPCLFALDVDTGAESWRRKLAPTDQGALLLGVNEDTLFYSDRDLTALETATGQVRWNWSPPAGDVIAGRSAVTRDGILVPTRAGMIRLTLRGETTRSWPWRPGKCGNLLVADGAVVVASGRGLAVHVDVEARARALAIACQERSDDPWTTFRLGKSLATGDDSGKAVPLFETCVRLAAARPDAESARLVGLARRTLSRLHLDLARRAWSSGDRATARVESLQAKESAPDAAGVVEVAFALADALVDGKEPAAAVAELQTVIEDHPDTPCPEEAAGEIARRQIERILDTAGREAYAAVEERAGALAAAAERTGDATGWRAVVDRFPNSRAAEEALLRLARSRLEAGDADGALQHLRLLLRSRDLTRRPEAMALVALSWERRGEIRTAFFELVRLRSLFPEALIPGPAGPVPVTEFVQERLSRPEYQRTEAMGARRELTAPLHEAWSFSDPGAWDLELLQPDGPMPAAADDLVFVASRGAVRALQRKTGAEIWRTEVEPPVVASCFSDRSLIVCSRTSVVSLTLAAGRKQWRVRPEEFDVHQARISSGILFLGTNQRVNKATLRLSVMDAATGRELWSAPYRDVWPFLLGREGVVVPTSRDEFSVLRREDGAASRPIALGGRPLHVVQPGLDRFVVMVARNRLAGFEVSSGRRLWQKDTGQLMSDFLMCHGGTLAFVERVPGSVHIPWMVVMDPEGGDVRVRVPISEGDFPINAAIDGERYYVTFRKRADRERLYVSAFRLSDGSRAWTSVEIVRGRGASPSVSEPILSGSWFLLNAAWLEQPAGRWLPGITVLQRTNGTVVQEIVAGPARPLAPRTVAFDGVLAILQGDTLRAYVGEE